jgi:hypothetical protein
MHQGVGGNWQEVALIAEKHRGAMIIVADEVAHSSGLNGWLKVPREAYDREHPNLLYPKPEEFDEQFQNDSDHVYLDIRHVPSNFAGYLYSFHPTNGTEQLFGTQTGRILKSGGRAYFATAQRDVRNNLLSSLSAAGLEMYTMTTNSKGAASFLGLYRYPESDNALHENFVSRYIIYAVKPQ